MAIVAIDLLKEYEAGLPNLNICKMRVENLVEILLKDASIRIHSLNGRVKERNSFEKKIQGKPEKYNSLHDITDLVGIRIITYLESETKQVVDLIRREFTIDEQNSTNKSEALLPEQFGYRSIHLVATINSERSKLGEYRAVAKIPFEIQVRSILQHAWAEIEHDMGYKSEIEIPNIIKRRFSRLSGLLELADEEFDDIHVRLARYSKEIGKNIQSNPDAVALDKQSLEEFILHDTMLKELDTALLKAFPGIIIEETKTRAHWNASVYASLGIKTIGELKEAVASVKSAIVPFAIAYAKEAKDKSKYKIGPKIEHGYALWWFGYYFAWQQGKLEEYVKTNLRGLEEKHRKRVADIVATASKNL